MKKPLSKYIIRKNVFAHSLQEALKLEKSVKPVDIFLDEEYEKFKEQSEKKEIGFKKNEK